MILESGQVGLEPERLMLLLLLQLRVDRRERRRLDWCRPLNGSDIDVG